MSNSSKPSDCCRKVSVHKMASVNELKNELSTVVNSTVSNLKRNRTETMLDKELLKRRSHKRTTYPGQKKIGGSIHVYNDAELGIRSGTDSDRTYGSETEPGRTRSGEYKFDGRGLFICTRAVCTCVSVSSIISESREEIVSSIAALSESICEKVGELKNMDRDSDSDDVQGK